MDEKKRFTLPPYIMLMLVSIVMSFAIAGVYTVTKDTIEAAAVAAQEAARRAVMEDAAVMTEIALPEDAPLDYAYEAFDENGGCIGIVSQITVVGFGGEIEVTVGMDTEAAITAIEVGGSDFSETSGLGAKTREPAFKDQFAGKSGMLVLKQNIDSVTGASISSGAVVSGVNKAVEYMKTLLPEGTLSTEVEEIPLAQEQIAALLPGVDPASVVWMGGGTGIDGWWQADGGYIVRATGFGEGPIAVTLGFDDSKTVTGILIGDENFMETEGRGDGVLADWYQAQFIGKSGAQAYGAGVDAISGATVTSDATLAAINACMTFDPGDPGEAAPLVSEAEAASLEADAATEASVTEEKAVSEEPDAATEASIVEESISTEEPDAETEASIVEESVSTEEPDAVTEASVPEEEAAANAEPTPAPAAAPDAATEASVPEEEPAPSAAPQAAQVPPWDPVVPNIVPSARYAAPVTADAVTEASVPAKPTPTPTPDAVTEASIPEE